jgi:peptidoglycan hydrolase CwlO-like protein
MNRKKPFLQFCAFVAIFCILAVNSPYSVAADVTTTADQYSQNQDQAASIKDDLSSLQKKLDQATQKKQSLEKNLGQIKSSLGATVAAIGKTKALLRDTTDTIKRKELEVQLLEENIQFKKEMLTALMQEIYFNADKPLAEVVLSENDFSGALDEISTMTTLSGKVKTILDEVQGLKGQTDSERANLENMKKENERVLAEKARQQQALAGDQAEVQADVADQEKIISRLKKELAQLQGDLASLTGKSYHAKDIREAVELASKRTGVPEGVLYGFLKMETNLGANTGKCTYKEVEDVAVPRYKTLLKKNKNWQLSIDLLYKRQGLFYDLVKSLGYGKDKKVSCSPAPSSYIGQGGGMGIPQFMSDVWKGYSARITVNTGHGKPDPWELTDGVMAMALKLSGAGANSSKEAVIKKASINYLGTFNNNYYSGIVYWSKNYKALFQ